MRRPVRDALALAILLFLMFGIAALDCVAGRNISLWFVYVVPIALAAAIGGLRAGIIYSLLAGGLLASVGMTAGHPFPDTSYLLFEIFGDVFAYLVIVALALGVREQLHRGLGELLPPSASSAEELKRMVPREDVQAGG